MLKIKDLPVYSYKENKNYSDKEKNVFKGRTFLFPSVFFASAPVKFDGATGHMVKERLIPGGKYQNEVISLAYGAQKMLDDSFFDLGGHSLLVSRMMLAILKMMASSKRMTGWTMMLLTSKKMP